MGRRPETSPFSVTGTLVDVVAGRMAPATVHIRQGKIAGITPGTGGRGTFITPGLVDSHVHVESSMLPPSEFGRMALTHGTVAAVCDPHEIANVLGTAGIEFMIENARTSPFRFSFGAPPCVPATPFETSGASIGIPEIEDLLARSEVTHLAEVMNYPAVIARDPVVMRMIDAARRAGKPVDGHAPGLTGDALASYAASGITTDHETTVLEEALEKVSLGMKVIIRQGSAARDFAALHELLDFHGDRCMFCSDDTHPDDLARGHMDRLVADAVRRGHDPVTVLRCASLIPVRHYGLASGLLQVGDPADFLVVDDLEGFRVLETYCAGRLVAKEGTPLVEHVRAQPVNIFRTGTVQAGDIALRAESGTFRLMEATDGSLLTGRTTAKPLVRDGRAVSDPQRDILKIVVVNRYRESPPAVAFVRGFGLREGAMASSVAHDSHNIIAVGVSDGDICAAVNALVASRGGLAVVSGSVRETLPLPVAGLMAGNDGWEVARGYARLQALAAQLGSSMRSPFITLSFMALLVIPSLKLSDRGLFDAERFAFTPLWAGSGRD